MKINIEIDESIAHTLANLVRKMLLFDEGLFFIESFVVDITTKTKKHILRRNKVIKIYTLTSINIIGYSTDMCSYITLTEKHLKYSLFLNKLTSYRVAYIKLEEQRNMLKKYIDDKNLIIV
jgi:hypothetical protein